MPGNSLPELLVKINGSPLEEKIQGAVTRATIRSHLDRSDTFQLEIDSGMEYLVDSAYFDLGAAIQISLGQADDMTMVFDGEITAWFCEFVDGKGMKFTVRGADRSHRMHRSVRNRAFNVDSDSAAVKQIAGEYGLSPEVTDTAVYQDVRIQMNQTDHAFIRDRARRLGWIYRVEGKKLIFAPPSFEDSGKAFSTEENIATWDIGMDLSPVVTKVQVYGWDMVKKKPITSDAAPGKELWAPSGSQFGPKLAKKYFGEAPAQVMDIPVATQDEADDVAKGLFQKLSENCLKGPVTVAGDPELKVGTLVSLNGLGKALDGSYLAGEIVHIYTRDSGYVTRIMAIRNALNL